MVCDRCKRVIKEELEKLGYHVMVERLGHAKIYTDEQRVDLEKIDLILQVNGFELLLDKNAQIIEKIRTSIIDLIYSNRLGSLEVNLSEHLTRELSKDYSALSSLFSAVEGLTIEKYFILQKIERVKELLIYNELTLSETAYKLGYSSVQHLSNQFKKTTGMSASQFRALHQADRKSIDHIGHL
ncbi:MAG: helix-turn-helix transcriptional regulator [Candidatus Marinimicrobia bacterium]|nr:helix-turn-helix transcriptional regulator [Candidatus Neomarinimicrobiota bacterium]